jgi:rod shape determining protein RodA
VAIGNGGVTGKGLGQGVANETGHLPERSSDSIFAVIAEEGGFLGSSALVLGYLLFSGLFLVAAGGTRERFSRMVIAGTGLYFAAHFAINAGVNLGLIPMTGLTLPLMSTGGSSLLVSLMLLGMALGLSARAEVSLDSDSFRE